MTDDARALDAGCRVGDAAYDACGVDARADCAAGVQALEMPALVFAAVTLEIPPRYTVLYSYHDRVIVHQGIDIPGGLRDLCGLYGKKYDVLRASVVRIAG